MADTVIHISFFAWRFSKLIVELANNIFYFLNNFFRQLVTGFVFAHKGPFFSPWSGGHTIRRISRAVCLLHPKSASVQTHYTPQQIKLTNVANRLRGARSP